MTSSPRPEAEAAPKEDMQGDALESQPDTDNRR
jgi:hypothetical protein